MFIVYIMFAVIVVLKNGSSSTTHKKILSLREFKKINKLIYELILIKVCMNANIINTQIFH